MSAKRQLSIFNFLDFKAFLKSRFEELKKKEGKSLRRISLELECGSLGYVSMILNGKRSPGAAFLKKTAAYLGLTAEEERYLRKLVRFSLAENLDEKDLAYRSILKEFTSKNVQTIREKEYKFFSEWYHPVILEYLSLGRDIDQVLHISQALDISAKEVENSLKLLRSLDFIEEEAGLYKTKLISFQTTPEVNSFYVRKHHRMMLERSMRALSLPLEKRFFASLTVSMDEAELPKLKKRAEEFQKELLAEYSESKIKNQVIHFNLQIFPALHLKQTREDN